MSVWDRIEGLEEAMKGLARDGTSSSAIAAELNSRFALQLTRFNGGGLTRNAVIGRLSRAKDPSARLRTRAEQTSSSRSPRRVQRHPATSSLSAPPLRKASAPSAPQPRAFAVSVKRARSADELPEPVSLALSIDALKESTCRWPSGVGLDFKAAQPSPTTYCGHPTWEGRVYCEHHSRRAFVPNVRQPRQPRGGWRPGDRQDIDQTVVLDPDKDVE